MGRGSVDDGERKPGSFAIKSQPLWRTCERVYLLKRGRVVVRSQVPALEEASGEM